MTNGFRIGLELAAAVGVLFLGLLVPGAKSQDYRHFTTSDGLLSDDVFVIRQDSRGLLWIGTSLGLQRFDGRNFETVLGGPVAQGAGDNRAVRHVVEADAGAIWTVYGDRLVRIDPDTFETSFPLSGASVEALGRKRDGTFVVGVRGEIFHLDPSTWPNLSPRPISIGLGFDASGPHLHGFTDDALERGWYLLSQGQGLAIREKEEDWTTRVSVQTSGVHSALFELSDSLLAAGRGVAVSERLGTDAVYETSLKIGRSTWVLIDCRGESRALDSDFGWIENERGRTIWSMKPTSRRQYENALKSRGQFAVIRLDAGTYRARYRSIDAHAYDERTPMRGAEHEQHGIRVLPLTDEEASRARRFQRAEHAFKSLPGDPLVAVPDANGGMWIDMVGGRIAHISPYFRSFAVYDHQEVLARAVDEARDSRADGDILFAPIDSEGRYHLLQWTSNTSAPRRLFQLPPLGRRDQSPHEINAILEDRTGLIWIALDGGGLLALDVEPPGISVYRSGDDNPLKGQFIRAVAERLDHQILVASERGLELLDLNSGEAHDWTAGLAGQEPVSIMFADDHSVWVGTNGHGLLHLDSSGALIRAYRKGPVDEGSLAGDIVLDILCEATGAIIARTWNRQSGGALNRLDPSTGRLRRIDHSAADSGSSVATRVNHVVASRTGELLVATDSGLSRYDPNTGSLGPYDLGIAGGILALVEGDDGTLWAAPGSGGLGRVDWQRGLLTMIRGAHGLGQKRLISLAADHHGAIWATIADGSIGRLDPLDFSFHVFGEDDGVDLTVQHPGSATKLADGSLIYGGKGGIIQIDPDRFSYSEERRPAIAVTEISVDGERISYGNSGSIVLQPNDSVLRISFAAVDYRAPESRRYLYRLDPYDSELVPAFGDGTAEYVRLRHGHYQFKVAAANHAGIWNWSGISLSVHVKAPLVARWWFLALLALGTGLLTLIAYRLHVSNQLRLDRLRLRIAGDLHDDLGSKLGSIGLLSDLVADNENLSASERSHLHQISHSARHMVDEMREIVWMINPQYDRLDDLLTRMEHVTPVLLRGMRHTFESSCGAVQQRLPLEDRRNLYLLFKEALHNVARHSGASKCSVRITCTDGVFTLDIRDNGVGFDTSIRHSGTGFVSMRERAKSLGGRITIIGVPGAGAHIRLSLQIRERRALVTQ